MFQWLLVTIWRVDQLENQIIQMWYNQDLDKGLGKKILNERHILHQDLDKDLGKRILNERCITRNYIVEILPSKFWKVKLKQFCFQLEREETVQGEGSFLVSTPCYHDSAIYRGRDYIRKISLCTVLSRWFPSLSREKNSFTQWLRKLLIDRL